MTPHEFWSAALTKMGRGIIYGQYRPIRHTLFFDDILMEGTTLEQAYDHLAPFRLKNKTPKGQFSLGRHIVFFSSHLSMNAASPTSQARWSPCLKAIMTEWPIMKP